LLQLIILLLVSISCNKTKPPAKKKNLTKTNMLMALGHEFYVKQEFDSSYYYYNKAKNEAEIVQDSSRIIHSLGWMAEIQTNQGDYTGSENACVEALPYLGNKGKFLYGETNIYVRLANNYLNTSQFKNAILYYTKAINDKTDLVEKANMKNNIAFVLTQLKKYSEALQTYKILLKQKEVKNVPENRARVLNNLGYCYLMLGNREALPYLQKALNIRVKLGHKYALTSSYYNLVEYYKDRNSKVAIQYALTYYQIANKMNFPDVRLESLQQLIKITSGAESKKYTLLYLKINDSIATVRQKSKNTFAKIKYDATQEKEENKRLKEQEAENLLQLELQKYKTYGLYLLILIILILSLYTYNYLKRKNRREKIQVSYLTELQIAKKLHDELANDVYRVMKFVEKEDLTSVKNKEVILQNLDIIYTLTRNISIENSNIETGVHFKPQLKEMVFGFNTISTNIIINNLDDVNWAILTDEHKITVFRVLQELLVNMKKHSQCGLAVLSFTSSKKTITIAYTDDGLGVNPGNTGTTNGLQNMENRLKALKGTIIFESEQSKGFKAQISFPI
jgi:tetratricopeptide (TPR) repeat protein